MQNYLNLLLTKKHLKDKDTEAVFSQMLNGELSDAQLAAVLVAWRFVGETSALLVAGAKQLRAHGEWVEVPSSFRPLSDNCGTGGSGFAKFNVSTTAAIVSASMGVRMAKHGNRSVSGVCGSADLLFATGLSANLTSEATLAILEKTGFGFFFAPNWHPKMKNVMPVRKSLGIRTVFNLLGPLANPLRPEIQLLGVADRTYLRPMADALGRLGSKKALVLHARDGLDEMSTAAPTDMIYVHKGKLKVMTLNPQKLKIRGKKTDLKSSGVEENLDLFWATLSGEKTRTQDAVCLNTGAMLWLNDKADSIADGFMSAKATLASGRVLDYFKDWLAVAKTYE